MAKKVHFFIAFTVIITVLFSTLLPLFQLHLRNVGFSRINTTAPIRLKDDKIVRSIEPQTETSLYSLPVSKLTC